MKTEDETILKPYNSRLIDIYIRLVKERYPRVDIYELLEFASMEYYQVVDPGHWFSQEQVDSFYEKLVAMTGNKSIAQEAGQYAAHLQGANLMSKYFLSMIGPLAAFDFTSKVSMNFTRAEIYKTRKLSATSIEVEVTPKEGIREKPFQCENRAGLLEAISLLHNKTPPVIDHPECIFRGDKSCTYIIRWNRTPSVILGNILRFFLPFLAVLNITGLVLRPIPTLHFLLPCSLIVGLAVSYLRNRKENHELSRHLQEVRSSTDELIKQININYNNTLIAHEIAQAVNRQMTIEEVLDSVIRISEKRLEFDRGLILLADEKKERLIFHKGFGYINKFLSTLKRTSFHLNKPSSRGIFVAAFRQQRPFLINDVNEIKKDLSPRSLDFMKKLGASSFICCPIICDSEPLGILAVDNMNSRRPLLQTDMSLLMSISSVIGIAIKNARLMENRENQFQSVIKALASSIDARDPLTAGHSEKVTHYALAICRELNLPREFQEKIRIAALLHDYGKIGIPDRILKKKGKLTTREYNILKTHADHTRTILEQINFEGNYEDVPEIASSHHERLDGDGYPNRMMGEDIPLGAKIIAVADFFEAITAKRHYRNPMTRRNAVKTLINEKGHHLDSEIVDAFLAYLEKSDAESDPETAPGSAASNGKNGSKKKPQGKKSLAALL